MFFGASSLASGLVMLALPRRSRLAAEAEARSRKAQLAAGAPERFFEERRSLEAYPPAPTDRRWQVKGGVLHTARHHTAFACDFSIGDHQRPCFIAALLSPMSASNTATIGPLAALGGCRSETRHRRRLSRCAAPVESRAWCALPMALRTAGRLAGRPASGGRWRAACEPQPRERPRRDRSPTGETARRNPHAHAHRTSTSRCCTC